MGSFARLLNGVDEGLLEGVLLALRTADLDIVRVVLVDSLEVGVEMLLGEADGVAVGLGEGDGETEGKM